jgi:bifunctional DNA-binding transcriptional regulator/antitoxin component of YhaV-PrlF toxin-antitoxin module
MSTARLRDRRQVTLPSDVVAAAQLEIDDPLEVRYANGVILLVPLRPRAPARDLGRFVGAAGTIYGKDSRAMDRYLQHQRDGW